MHFLNEASRIDAQKTNNTQRTSLNNVRDAHPTKKVDGCFLCGGPHVPRNCPKHAKFQAMIQSEQVGEDASVGSLRILNAIKSKTTILKIKKKGLQFVEAIIQGTPMRALVDSGETHNFIFV